jgi:energy-coupling factor transporter ATP-binding protein EcfA2
VASGSCTLRLGPGGRRWPLLQDEPTNHLDAESVAWLERFLADFKGTVVAVTHDRYFLDNVAGWILELDRGAGIPFEGERAAAAGAAAAAHCWWVPGCCAAAAAELWRRDGGCSESSRPAGAHRCVRARTFVVLQATTASG